MHGLSIQDRKVKPKRYLITAISRTRIGHIDRSPISRFTFFGNVTRIDLGSIITEVCSIIVLRPHDTDKYPCRHLHLQPTRKDGIPDHHLTICN